MQLGQQNPWSVKMTDAFMAMFPDLSDEWSHEYGVGSLII